MTQKQEKYLTEKYIRPMVRKMLRESGDYDVLAASAPVKGKIITFSAGRFKDEEAKILGPQPGINAWMCELMRDKVRVIVFPDQITSVNGKPIE